ncbi:MAG: GlsB/YeaQ/YmgE family stress response membrane protein [Gemmatimonadaceae bacterium]|nr:GlsB/YeaQ/YmgE family stress response membrane protein [Gemmatimonadaceae bacterium]
MSLLWTALIGLIAGALAKAIMPGRDPGGIIITMLLGVAGAMLGTFLGRSVGWYQPGEAAGLIAAVVGAVLILFLYRAMRGRGATV